MAGSESYPAALVDAHVHLHEAFDVSVFLEHARENLLRNWAAIGIPAAPLGYALLADPEGTDSLPRLRAAGHPGSRPVSTHESCSLMVEFPDGARLVFVAGRQIRTRERLEVLAFGPESRHVADGQSFVATLAEVWAHGAPAIVPWGLGKWSLGRRRLVGTAVAEAETDRLFLGDNGGRLRGTRPHSLFAAAARRGIWNLPGSDPLPFPDEVGKVMRYGSRLPVSPDPDAPYAALRRALAQLDRQPPRFGSLETPVRFLRAQARMQMRRRGTPA